MWKIDSGIKLKSFRAEKSETWGSFQFSSCSKYLARGCLNSITIYELPTLKIALDSYNNKLILEHPNLKKFSWIPNTINILATCYDYVI